MLTTFNSTSVVAYLFKKIAGSIQRAHAVGRPLLFVLAEHHVDRDALYIETCAVNIMRHFCIGNHFFEVYKKQVFDLKYMWEQIASDPGRLNSLSAEPPNMFFSFAYFLKHKIKFLTLLNESNSAAYEENMFSTLARFEQSASVTIGRMHVQSLLKDKILQDKYFIAALDLSFHRVSAGKKALGFDLSVHRFLQSHVPAIALNDTPWKIIDNVEALKRTDLALFNIEQFFKQQNQPFQQQCAAGFFGPPKLADNHPAVEIDISSMWLNTLNLSVIILLTLVTLYAIKKLYCDKQKKEPLVTLKSYLST